MTGTSLAITTKQYIWSLPDLQEKLDAFFVLMTFLNAMTDLIEISSIFSGGPNAMDLGTNG